MTCPSSEMRLIQTRACHEQLPYKIFAEIDLETIHDLAGPSQSSDRAPLTGNIGSNSSTGQLSQSYLNSSISGEDRRAPTNTIDESVWETLSRDLLAVWEKMRLVLWPKHLLGGFLQGDTAIEDAERGVSRGFLDGVRAGRWPDTETVLQQRMSEGLRDWDLWQVHSASKLMLPLTTSTGALLFSAYF